MNERQTLSFSPAIPTGGTVDVSSASDTETLDAADFADAAALQSALEAFSDIGSGNIEVTDLGGGVYQAEFKGALANQNIAELTKANEATTVEVDDPDLDPQVTGVAPVQEVQVITLSGGTAATGDLVINGVTVASGIAMTAADVEAAIENAGGANLPCTVSGTTGTGPFTVTAGVGGDISDTLLDFTGTTLDDTQTITVESVLEGGGGNNETQVIGGWTQAPTGGTFTLTFDGQTTGPIAHNANGAAVTAALEALSNIGSGNVICGTDSGGVTPTYLGPIGTAPMAIMFQGSLANTDLPLCTADSSSLECRLAVDVDTTTQGVTGVKAVIRVSWNPAASAGSFTLQASSPAFTTAAIAFNADASAVDAAFAGGTPATAVTCTDIGTHVVDVEFDDAGPIT